MRRTKGLGGVHGGQIAGRPEEADEEQISDDSVDARLADVAATIAKIRNAAASGGTKQLAAIINECDRARATIFGIPFESGGAAKPSGNDKADGSPVGATAKADHQRVGRQRAKVKSGSK